jgi:hypothetical protein
VETGVKNNISNGITKPKLTANFLWSKRPDEVHGNMRNAFHYSDSRVRNGCSLTNKDTIEVEIVGMSTLITRSSGKN